MDHSTLKKEITRLFNYGMVTIASYLFLFVLMIILTELAGINPEISYASALTLTYFLLFFVSSKHAFKTTPTVPAFFKFALIAASFWVLNNLGYLFFHRIADLHYMIAAAMNILTFGPVRYILYRNWVFINKQAK